MAMQNGTALIKYIFRLGTDPEDMIATIGVTRDDNPGPTALTAIYDAFSDNWLASLANVYTFRGFEMVGKTIGGLDYAEELFSNATGLSSAEPLPQNSALLVQKRTGLPGRKRRGRMYLPGMVAIANVSPNGTIDGTSLGVYQTAATGFYNDLTTVGATGIDDVAILHPDLTNTPVSALVVDDVLATQRRRLR